MRAKLPNADAEDLETLQTDNPHVFGRFVSRYERPVFSFLGQMGFSQTDSEDLAQEVFLRVWRSRKSYQSHLAKISTWLFTITRNVALTEIRKREKRLPINSNEIESFADPHPSHSPAGRFIETERADQLQKALQLLSIEDREVIALFYIRQLSAKDACAIQNCSAATFRTRLSRAKQRLIVLLSTVKDAGADPL